MNTWSITSPLSPNPTLATCFYILPIPFFCHICYSYHENSEYRGWVESASASYSGGSGCKSLVWRPAVVMEYFLGSFSSWQKPGQYFQLDNNRIFSQSFEFLFHYHSPIQCCIAWARGVQILGAISPWRLNFVRWRQVFVDPQYWTCFTSPFWHIEFRGSSKFFGKLVEKLVNCHKILSFFLIVLCCSNGNMWFLFWIIPSHFIRR
jgi:hypothetical protein